MSMKSNSLFPISRFPNSAFSRWVFLTLTLLALCLIVGAQGFAFNKKAQKDSKAPVKADDDRRGAPTTGGDLSSVLATMNQSAGKFQRAQAAFEFVTYQKIVDEKETQQGRIYFRRGQDGVDAAFNIGGKTPKQVVYRKGKIRIYEPNINQITERDVSKNKADVEAFLSLGFGAHGDDLVRDYDVKLAGWEMVDSTKTARLELVPKSEKLRQTYNRIVLWIDPVRDVLLQQQFFEPSGDYRLAHYTDMKLNGNLSDDVFSLKTTGKPTVIKP
jgi:outer membrane lipoprotein-sorting protein